MILPIPAAASGGGRRPAVTTRPLANEDGVDLLKYPLEEEHRRIFENLAKEDTSYRELIRQLSAAGRPAGAELTDRHSAHGSRSAGRYDKHDNRVLIQDRLRFDGVGTEYEV